MYYNRHSIEQWRVNSVNSGVWALLQRLTLNALVLRNLEGMKNGLES